MDVRCERCKTEYDFEDSRITEAGVTVRCTTCDHVFMVKKKALVVTVPVKQGGADPGVPLTQHVAPPAAPAADRSGREWRVRTADGNTFQFRELTTLQKWIVERKVMREDEISLNGESWKRLGSIAELSSFFHVVDEAQTAQQFRSHVEEVSKIEFAALEASREMPTAPLPYMAPPYAQQPAYAPQPPYAQSPYGPPPGTSAPPLSLGLGRGAGPPLEFHDEGPLYDGGHSAAKSGRGLLLVLALALLGAAAGVAYMRGMLSGGSSEPAEVTPPVAVAPRAPVPALPEDAGTPASAVAVAPPPAVAAAPVDAGRAAAVLPVDAGSAPPARAEKRAEAEDFETLMKQGDRMRLREKPTAALAAYGKAILLDATRAEPHAGRALVFLDQGDAVRAEASFEAALQLDPRHAVALIGMAETYRTQSRNAEAVEYYERYLEVAPTGPEAEVARAAIQRLKN